MVSSHDQILDYCSALQHREEYEARALLLRIQMTIVLSHITELEPILSVPQPQN